MEWNTTDHVFGRWEIYINFRYNSMLAVEKCYLELS